MTAATAAATTAATDETEFAAFVDEWNALQGQATPDLHREICRWLAGNRRTGHRQLLLMAFRNSGKSTLVGLFAAWLLACDPDLRILVLAADLTLAKKMVRNVKRIIERHPRTAGLKPRQADQWAAEQFTVERPTELRDPSMLARGITANITGSRADIVICDDVEVPNTCDTAPKRADLRLRLGEIDYVMVPGGTQLYVGTPHTYYTIYAESTRPELGEEAPFLDGFARLSLPVLDAGGNSRWPERFPPDAIERIRRHTGPNKFASQMMLTPVNIADGRLDPDLLRPYDDEILYRESHGEPLLTLAGRRLVAASCWWDPALGAGAPGGGAGTAGRRGGDASVIAAVFFDDDGGCWLHRIRYIETDPDHPHLSEADQSCAAVVDFVRDLHVPSVRIERNGIGAFLPGLLRQAFARARVACAIVPVASTKAKAVRILEAFDAVLAARRLHAHRGIWDTPFVREMREWRPSGKAALRDDGLDAVAGCLAAEPARFGPVRRPAAAADWRPGTRIVVADSDFEV